MHAEWLLHLRTVSARVNVLHYATMLVHQSAQCVDRLSLEQCLVLVAIYYTF